MQRRNITSVSASSPFQTRMRFLSNTQRRRLRFFNCDRPFCALLFIIFYRAFKQLHIVLAEYVFVQAVTLALGMSHFAEHPAVGG